MIYVLVHFAHVLGALGIAAAYAVEAAGLVGLRGATSGQEARTWLRTRRWVMRLGPPAIVLVLASGGYAIATGWGWRGWIQVSLVSLVALAVIGGVLTGIPMARLGPDVERAPDGALPGELRQRLRAPVLTVSMTTRVALTCAIVFLMVRKPDLGESVAVVGVCGALGALVGYLPRLRGA